MLLKFTVDLSTATSNATGCYLIIFKSKLHIKIPEEKKEEKKYIFQKAWVFYGLYNTSQIKFWKMT